MTKSATQPLKGNVVHSTEDYPGNALPSRLTDEAAWIKAAETACEKAGYVQFLDDEMDRFCDAVEEAPILLCRAANVFRLLGELLQGRDYEGHFGLADMAMLASRALEDAQGKEGEHLSQLGSVLRQGRAKTARAKIAAGAA
jgi:hypothetical protein